MKCPLVEFIRELKLIEILEYFVKLITPALLRQDLAQSDTLPQAATPSQQGPSLPISPAAPTSQDPSLRLPSEQPLLILPQTRMKACYGTACSHSR